VRISFSSLAHAAIDEISCRKKCMGVISCNKAKVELLGGTLPP